jgi:dolichyl-phosphate-mannose-protein mannosyltransferase
VFQLRKITCLLLCLASLVVISTSVLAEQNLLTNGDFEKAGSGQVPVGWQADCWKPSSVLTVTDKKVHSGKYALQIKSGEENDARMIQVVKVKPNTYYRLSGWVAAENVSLNKNGANIGVVLDFNFAKPVSGTADWTPAEFNFQTDASQTEVTIAARLGMWGDTVTGTAYFDDLSLVELANAPASFNKLVVQNAAASQAANSQPANTQTAPAQSNPDSGFMKVSGGWLWFTLLILAIIVIMAIIFFENKKKV